MGEWLQTPIITIIIFGITQIVGAIIVVMAMKGDLKLLTREVELQNIKIDKQGVEITKLGEVLTKQALADQRISLADQRMNQLDAKIEDLRRGEGYIRYRRRSVEGEYPASSGGPPATFLTKGEDE